MKMGNGDEYEKYFNKDCLCGKYSISGVKPYRYTLLKFFP